MQIACSQSIPAVLAFLGCTCVYGKSGFSPFVMTSTSLPDTSLGWITPSLIISVAGTYLQSITFALTPWPLTPPPPTFSVHLNYFSSRLTANLAFYVPLQALLLKSPTHHLHPCILCFSTAFRRYNIRPLPQEQCATSALSGILSTVFAKIFCWFLFQRHLQPSPPTRFSSLSGPLHTSIFWVTSTPSDYYTSPMVCQLTHSLVSKFPSPREVSSAFWVPLLVKNIPLRPRFYSISTMFWTWTAHLTPWYGLCSWWLSFPFCASLTWSRPQLPPLTANATSLGATSNSRCLDVSFTLNGPRHANIRKASILSLCPAFHIHLFVQSPQSITSSAWCLLVLTIRSSAFLLQPALLLSLRPSSLRLSRNYLANSALHLRTIPLIVFTGAVPLLRSRQEPRNICSNSTATGALMLTSNT